MVDYEVLTVEDKAEFIEALRHIKLTDSPVKIVNARVEGFTTFKFPNKFSSDDYKTRHINNLISQVRRTPAHVWE